MKRPFKDKRPFGPFAQSSSFRDKFLNRKNQQTFNQGDDGVIVVSPGQGGFNRPENIGSAISYFIEEELRDFVGFVEEANGTIESTSSIGIQVVLFAVQDITDRDVTVSQVEDAIGQFLREEGMNVRSVSIYKSSVQ